MASSAAGEHAVVAGASIIESPASRPPDLEVRTLGPFETHVRGRRIEAWPYAKPKELLAFLLVHRAGATRAAIGAALWPDASAAQVRNSFHVTMHHVRRTLAHADWVILEGERYRIAADVSVALDADAFEEHARGALAAPDDVAGPLLRDALSMYRGHFLQDEAAGVWRDDVQDRLRRLFCDVGLRLGALLDAADDHAAAAGVYEAVVAGEPLHEQAHRGLLLALTRTGRRAQALRHYERLAGMLDQLELEPEEETVELYGRIRTADIVPRGREAPDLA
jgi:DNA-binding SARP family transcriptional activator